MDVQEPVQSPFKVYVDSAESQPFTFQGLRADADRDWRPLIVPIEFRSLGRHPHSLGDYSGEGLMNYAHVERKSLEDAQSTVLGWETPSEKARSTTGRRERFEKELENLSKIAHGLVIVEASFADCLRHMPSWGTKSSQLNAKVFARSVSAYMQDYSVHWMFAGDRRVAEVLTYRFLERAWKKRNKAKKRIV